MRMRLAAGVVLVLCRSVFGQGTDVDIPYQKFVLKNGLTLIVHEDHKAPIVAFNVRSEEHTSELQSPMYLVCRLLLEKKKTTSYDALTMHFMRINAIDSSRSQQA